MTASEFITKHKPKINSDDFSTCINLINEGKEMEAIVLAQASITQWLQEEA